ncbi:MAG: hypothetical protein NT090_00910 [Acidobacteria bacterium]|nr:hypothetical protein [Acidobacteriota bacterium]
MRAYVRQYRRKYLDRWAERWADTRIHGATTRRIAAMFAEEHPALLPLPLEQGSVPKVLASKGTGPSRPSTDQIMCPLTETILTGDDRVLEASNGRHQPFQGCELPELSTMFSVA